ncbi:MAG TPA: hypothetical protein VF116_09350, partial [Ktedonobacterales bacterium]
TLDNLLVNPTLSDLVGGVQAVTLGDEEARRRGTQKTVLERKAPPTFDVLVEQEERDRVGVHLDVAAAVDGLLRGEAPQREMRERQSDGTIRRWVERAPRAARADGVGLPTREAPIQREELASRRTPRSGGLAGPRPATAWWEQAHEPTGRAQEGFASAGWLDSELARGAALIERDELPATDPEPATGGRMFRKRRIFPMGLNRTQLEQAIRELGLPAVITNDEHEADALMVLKSLYRRQPDRVDRAHAAGVPVYVLRGTGVERLREALSDLFRPDMEQMRRASATSAVAGDDSADSAAT